MARSSSSRPSMADVGRLAEVSAQTVSRYCSGTGYVGEATSARIAAAIRELGYVPNRAAGTLRAGRTGTLGVLTIGELNYGSAQILTGLSRTARELHQTLMIAEIDTDFEATGWQDEVRRTIDHFLSAPVDGIVVSTAIPGVDAELDRARSRVPVVNLSRRLTPAPAAGSPPRGGDDSPSSVGFEATRHLIDLGHERILHVAGPRTRNEARDREAGYRNAMEQAGLVPHVLSGAADWWAWSGAAAAEQLAGGDETTASADLDFTAVFAANDELALGFMSALRMRGFEAPRDYSIVGVDDMPAAAYLQPPLTTMRIDFVAVGDQALRRLHHAITTGSEEEGDGEGTASNTLPELVVRASTAPPPRH
ncbi:LacI family DNA-binding transcriptional regulator [Brachybacterium kimchii]|uniref:LacI family transcriptional regulator n=1 Tax=Brachybacterium kimchii TaxID=2942909 RepID=A0ABY4N2R8_9MICO|nr:LacI family DNA-binding transcriptional regulator [Brachybacterium kimchii]UQN28860.1 LacI family transcriptional regulator [Brachybacterium kimchii]